MKKLIFISCLLFISTITTNTQEIFDAVKANDLAKVKVLVEANLQIVNAKDADGRTPLHLACDDVHFEVLKFLVDKGADVNAKDNDGIAPLHSLAAKAHSRGISLLIANKADVYAKSRFQNTPLHYAAQSGNTDVVKLLLDNGADPTARNNMRITPLIYAIRENNVEMAEYLISKGGDVDPGLLDTYHSVTPFTTAISIGNIEIVKMLHRRGSDIRYRTEYGENYLYFAAAHNRVDIAEYLINCGIDMNSVKNGGLTPLHIAAIFGRSDMVKLLVDKGANLDLKSKDGGTPLHFAVAARNYEIADFLRQSGAEDIPREFPEYKGKYLGQKKPGTTPEPFIPELFLDIYRSYSAPAFSPDGKEVFWIGYIMPWIQGERIWWMREENGKWIPPEVAPFYNFRSASPTFSNDGKKLFFAAWRNVDGKTSRDMDLWYVEVQDGTWSEPKNVGSPPNKAGVTENNPMLAKDGTLYFQAFGPGTGGIGVYRSKFKNGKYTKPQSLNDFFDSDITDDCIDIEYIIFHSPKRNRTLGTELFICFHKPDGKWTKPVYLGDKFHKGHASNFGKISPDGKYFFFLQDISLYWVDAKIIDELKSKELK